MSEFEKLVGKVKRIKTDKNPEFTAPKKPTPAKPTKLPRQSGQHSEQQSTEDFDFAPVSMASCDIGVEDFIEYRREGIQHALMKKLSQGQLPVVETIDLHGMTTEAAERYLHETIIMLTFPYQTCIKVIHGKGYHSDRHSDYHSGHAAAQAVTDNPWDGPAPILKNFTARYLSAHPRVLAFVSCPRNKGGTGAVYVLIARANRS
ncbi:Smr/MutS family protein [Ostreibacterium oceani]|uniref:Smr domain-containing protein n=1 Tax=Ostreibacterium oceani TaxID=2654998 RepID=A0A6N7EYC3_9GAMM|nr:Smr/MutS family protein [Ostreibacterium oceani]MPV86127.1 hypothetical protein [Ostreibacterium oceani]